MMILSGIPLLKKKMESEFQGTLCTAEIPRRPIICGHVEGVRSEKEYPSSSNALAIYLNFVARE